MLVLHRRPVAYVWPAGGDRDPADVAAELLDGLVDEVDGGLQLAAGAQIDGLVRHYPVRLLAVPPALAAAWMPLVGWAYDGKQVPCLQLVYPDQQGRWPWQSDVRQGFAATQPVLERLGDAASG